MPHPFDSSNTAKRRRTADQSHAALPHEVVEPPQEEEETPLIPGLPDHIAQICLSSLPPSLLYSVCRSWRKLIYSSFFPPFLSLYALLSPSSTSQIDQNQSSTPIQFSCFDPISSSWQSLPPPPPDPPLRFLLRHPSFLSRNLPVQSISAADNLILLAATTHHFLPALPRPLVFSPVLKSWSFGPPLSSPRRWCAFGCSSEIVYVASGIGSQYNSDVARSVERWNLYEFNNKKRLMVNHLSSGFKSGTGINNDCRDGIGKWEKLGMLKDGRLSREAIEAIGCKGKLYMVNVKGNCAKEGVVYDTEKDSWEEMSDGMVAGWRGPAASMDEEVIFTVAESRGALMRYDSERDEWKELIEDERLKGAQQIVAGGGRVCVVGDCGGIVVVDVVASPPRIRVVETPVGLGATAVHILPRMNRW